MAGAVLLSFLQGRLRSRKTRAQVLGRELELPVDQSERLAKDLDELKNKHETDMANMRKSHAGLQRDKSPAQLSAGQIAQPKDSSAGLGTRARAPS
jgi:hypothetical protein